MKKPPRHQANRLAQWGLLSLIIGLTAGVLLQYIPQKNLSADLINPTNSALPFMCTSVSTASSNNPGGNSPGNLNYGISMWYGVGSATPYSWLGPTGQELATLSDSNVFEQRYVGTSPAAFAVGASDHIGEQQLTVTCDTGTIVVYTPNLPNVSTNMRLYVAKDGSTYHSRADHNYSTWPNPPDLTPTQALRPEHLAKAAPTYQADCYNTAQTSYSEWSCSSSSNTTRTRNKTITGKNYNSTTQNCDTDATPIVTPETENCATGLVCKTGGTCGTPDLVPGSDGLLGYWQFDGNGNNEVVGSPSAVIVGNAIVKAEGGKLGGYAYIPSQNDWLKIPYHSAFDLPNSFTIEFWFRQRSNQNFFQDLVYKGNLMNNYNFRIFRQLWNQYNFGPIIAGHTAANTGYWTQPSNPNQLAHNEWHHVVFTKDITIGTAYYLDGVRIGNLTYAEQPTYSADYSGPAKTPATDIIIGDTAVDTDIDNLRIYNRALSAREVRTNGGFPAEIQPACTGGAGRTPGLPTCLMPENLAGTAWNEVENATGKVLNTAVCSVAVCGRNGEWRNARNMNGTYYANGYPPNSTYIQTPFNAGSGGQYYTNGVWQTANNGIVQPGSTQIIYPTSTPVNTGTYTTGSGTYTTGSGTYTTGSGTYTTGSGTYATGSGTYATGSGTYTTGTGTYTTGSGTYTTGSGTYTTGSGTYATGTGTYATGTGTYATGSYATTTSTSGTPTSTSSQNTYSTTPGYTGTTPANIPGTIYAGTYMPGPQQPQPLPAYGTGDWAAPNAQPSFTPLPQDAPTALTRSLSSAEETLASFGNFVATVDSSKVRAQTLDQAYNLIDEANYYVQQIRRAVSEGNLAHANRRLGLLQQVMGDIKRTWEFLGRGQNLEVPAQNFFSSENIVKEELATYGMQDIADQIAKIIMEKINFSEIVSQVVKQSSETLNKLLAYSTKHEETVSKTMDVLVTVDEKFHEEYLNKKVEVLEAVDRFDEKLAAFEAEKSLKSELLDRIDGLKEKIIGYNFIGSTGEQMKTELEKFIEKFNDPELNEAKIEEEIAALDSEAEAAMAKAREEKFEQGAIPFKDTDDHEWFTQYVVPIQKEGIISGYKDAQGNSLGQFGPANNVTVAEILKIALESAELGEGEVTARLGAFEGHWAIGYVAKGKELGLTLLKEIENADQLNRPATRAEVVRVLLEVFNASVDFEQDTRFEDAQGHKDEAYIEAARELEIIAGYDDGTFRPDAPVNRAETSKIVNLVMTSL